MAQAIPYIRFSSFKQTESNSYQRQKEAVERWLKNNQRYTLSSLVFEDLGKSGFANEEKKKYKQASGLVKIAKAIESGMIKAGDVVLVEAFDRATRQATVSAISLITPILKAGVGIITLDDGIHYTEESLNGSHAYLLIAKIQAAHGYSKNLSERVKDSYRIRKDNAKKGEQIKRFVPVWLTTDGKIKEEIAPHIREAFSLYISGVGKTAIANRLRQSGVPELEKCSGPTVDGWLQNKTAIGYWDDVPNVYPAVVENDVFLLAQKVRKDRATKKPEKTAKHFLVGLVKCGVCGGNYIVNNVGGKPYNMRCGNRHRLKDNGCSNTKSIPKNILEVVRLWDSKFALERALGNITLSHSEKRKLEIEGEMHALSQNITQLVKLAAAVEDVSEIADQLNTLKAQRGKLQEELESLDKSTKENTYRLQQTAEEEKNLTVNDPIRLNALLRSAGFTITVFPDGRIESSESDGEDEVKYLGIKRKPLSNHTNWLRLQSVHKRTGTTVVFKVNPDVDIDTSSNLDDLRFSKESPFTGRLKDILLGVED